MKAVTRQTFIAGLAVTAVSLASGAALAQGAAKPGAPAPAFSIVDVDGKPQKLSDYAGKTVILEWTNHDCPYVRKHYNSTTMQTLQKDMAKDGIVWLSVISSPVGEQGHVDAAKAKELTKSRDAAPATILLDPKSVMARAYGAQTTPHMYIIDPRGLVVYNGAIDDKRSTNPADVKTAKNYVVAALDEMKAGKPVSEPATKA